MLSINTNISSLITQRSMKSATSLLNQAVERMSTGYKVNHAKDNAAAYSIITNMDTKISAYQVAEDNCAMGLDMLTTATESLDLIYDKLTRLRDLAEQASNGTYGEQSKKAINSEANALVDEINRIYNTSEYNGISLLGKSEESKFIKDIVRRDTSQMTTLESVKIDEALTSGTYSISTADELAKLATMTNNGLIGADTEFVLANDIDLRGYSNWTPIGTASKNFSAVFDGNGYEVQNLSIDTTSGNRGLFGVLENSEIKNLGVTNAKLDNVGTYSAIVVGCARYSSLENVYSTGTVNAQGSAIGGIIGSGLTISINHCYSISKIVSENSSGYVGGIVGNIINSSRILNSFTQSEITGYNGVGGIVGESGVDFLMENCYSNSIINSNNSTNYTYGGLVGTTYNGKIKNCISNSEINSSSNLGGGLVGWIYDGELVIENSQVLKDSNIKGIFVNTLNVSYAQNASLQLKNNSYNSEIMSASNLVGNIASLLPTKYSESGTNKNCSTIDTLGLINDGNIYSNDEGLTFQVGINSDDNSSLEVRSGYYLDGIRALRNIGIGKDDYLSKVDILIDSIFSKQTEFGAVQNRLDSALEEISTQYENLVSSRSTLRDADIAEISSQYIQQQILQQASATLMATANQAPAIALQLI